MPNEANNPHAARIAELNESIERLKQELAELEQKEEQLRKESKPKQPSTRKPKTPTLKLFNEAEKEQDHKAAEPTEDVFTSHAKKSSQPNAEEEELDLTLSPNHGICKKCGTPYQLLRRNFVYQELDLVPDNYSLVKYYTQTHICPACKDGTAISTQPRPRLMKQSMASVYTVAYTMVSKYAEDQSLTKYQKRLAKDGIQLSSATMANWIIRCADSWLKPLHRHMKQELLNQPVIHASSATVQVVSEDGTVIPSSNRIYAYVTDSRCTPIHIFDYNGKKPDAFLKGYSGHLVSSCDPEYTKLPKATHCACWFHLARLWNSVMEDSSAAETIKAFDGLRLCHKLLQQEEKCFRMSSNARRDYRRNISISTVEEFFLWVKHVDAEPGTKLAEAVSYTKAHQSELSRFLDHGDVSTTAAPAHQALKPFTTDKKPWQISDTPKGAQSSIIVYSIIQTALANGLNPFQYLQIVLARLPFYSKTPSHKDLSSLMPWDPEIKKRCTKED